ncbi:hypothetical protein Pfo_017434 [Paulownia fortunei]|nr:hypothetical protein Pfo_017434 [Paulownia fortunei]
MVHGYQPRVALQDFYRKLIARSLSLSLSVAELLIWKAAACQVIRVVEGRLEIMSGRGYYSNGDHIYMTTRPWSPDSPPIPPAAARSSQVAAAAAKPWGFSDPEMKRRKRMARYKMYRVEGRVKASIRIGLRWIKIKCSEIIHGY